MKKLKSYTGIWSVEKIIYAINDWTLPFPVTFTQMGWFVGAIIAVIMFQDMPPLSMTDNVLLKYIVIPVGVAWFMSQKTFDGKKPYNFLKSFIAYLVRPKVTYAGKPVKLRKQKVNETIAAVRSETYVPD